MPQEEWIKLKDNVDKDIEMHGFLSTSKNKGIALKFMSLDRNKKALITILVLPYTNQEEQGFAEIKEFSKHEKEDEILFNIRSRFIVLEVGTEKDNKGLEYRHVVLLYGGFSWKRHMHENQPTYNLEIRQNEICAKCEVSLENGQGFAKITNENSFFCRNCIKEIEIKNLFFILTSVLIIKPK